MKEVNFAKNPRKYEIIKQQIMSDIENGKYPPESFLPSEIELMNKFKASRITVRRAMDELVLAGYIGKNQGKKSYVKKNIDSQELTNIFSYTEEITRKGMMPSRKVISSCIRICTKREAENLLLDKASPVFDMQRIIYADTEPLCYTKTVLPYNLFNDIELVDFNNLSLYEILENKYNVIIQSTTLNLKAVAAQKPISKYLQINENIPLLFSSAVTYGIIDAVKIPIEMFESYYLTNKFEYRLNQIR